jgi:thiol-disulfide isomerase/thioredoxin/Flp pilus assembly protein TadD
MDVCGVLLKKTSALAVAVGLLALVASMAAQGTDATSAQDYHTDPKFMAAVKDAREMERAKSFGLAGDAYKTANKVAGGKCVECVAGLYKMQMMDGSYRDAVGTAREMQAMAATPMVRSVAAYDRGRALVAKGGEKPKPEQLEEDRAAFQEAMDLYPANTAAAFSEGEVLARMGRIEDARKEFELCLGRLKPTDPAWLRVKHFAEDPKLATQKMAPAFQVTAMDGARFNLDAMGGRVVLVDFWATWCGPCNEELPELKRIAKEFAGQPFVMISVSADQDEGVWKDFVAKHEMTWVQYRDGDHKLEDAFGVSAIPHYFTIDADGVLTSETMGEGSGIEGTLKKLIARAQEAKEQAAQVDSSASGVDGVKAARN